MLEIPARSQPLLESGALAYRLDSKGEPRVLVVTTAKGKHWGIPKGRVEPHLTFADNAAKEAWEEAGVLGELAPVAAGSYRAVKRVAAGETVMEVWVYLMKVTGTRDEFPEKGKRELKWLPPDEAAQLLREPLLVRLCQDLKPAKPHKKKSAA